MPSGSGFSFCHECCALTLAAGGTPYQASQAIAFVIKNMLGLICDPVAGLVEVPCVKRNAMGASFAFIAADMALAGIESKSQLTKSLMPCTKWALASQLPFVKLPRVDSQPHRQAVAFKKKSSANNFKITRRINVILISYLFRLRWNPCGQLYRYSTTASPILLNNWEFLVQMQKPSVVLWVLHWKLVLLVAFPKDQQISEADPTLSFLLQGKGIYEAQLFPQITELLKSSQYLSISRQQRILRRQSI